MVFAFAVTPLAAATPTKPNASSYGYAEYEHVSDRWGAA